VLFYRSFPDLKERTCENGCSRFL